MLRLCVSYESHVHHPSLTSIRLRKVYYCTHLPISATSFACNLLWGRKEQVCYIGNLVVEHEPFTHLVYKKPNIPWEFKVGNSPSCTFVAFQCQYIHNLNITHFSDRIEITQVTVFKMV